MVTLTDKAVKRFREHLVGKEDHGIRIFMAGGG